MIKELSLKKDIVVFLSILVVVLGGILALYWYDQKTGVVAEFAQNLFSRLLQ